MAGGIHVASQIHLTATKGSIAQRSSLSFILVVTSTIFDGRTLAPARVRRPRRIPPLQVSKYLAAVRQRRNRPRLERTERLLAGVPALLSRDDLDDLRKRVLRRVDGDPVKQMALMQPFHEAVAAGHYGAADPMECELMFLAGPPMEPGGPGSLGRLRDVIELLPDYLPHWSPPSP